MAKRKVYHLTFNGKTPTRRVWEVKLAGEVVGKCRLKANALRLAVKICKAQMPSQLIVHKQDGRIQYEHTYENDPRRTKG